MKFMFVLVCLIFIVIGIFKNKYEEYIKETSIAIMVISILNAIILTKEESIIYLDFFELTIDKINSLFNISIVVALISLIVFIYSDADI